MASFQAKIGWKMPKKRKKKKLSAHSVPTRRAIENSKRIVKNFKKLKIPLWLPFKQNRFKNAEKVRK